VARKATVAKSKSEQEVRQEAERLLQSRRLIGCWAVLRAYRTVRPKQTLWHIVLKHLCGREWDNPISLLRGRLSRGERIECRQEPACLTLRSRHEHIARRLRDGCYLQGIAREIKISPSTLKQYVSDDPLLAAAAKERQIAVIERALSSIPGYSGVVRRGSPPDTWKTTWVRWKCVVCGACEDLSARNIHPLESKRKRGYACHPCSGLLNFYSESEAKFLLDRYAGDRGLLANVIRRLVKVRNSAKRRGLKYDRAVLFSLTKPPTRCPRCGIAMKVGPGPLCPASLSIHRENASLGYIPGNVVWLCDACNSEEKHVTPKIALHTTLRYILSGQFTSEQERALCEALRLNSLDGTAGPNEGLN
jgi:hypothetical protein